MDIESKMTFGKYNGRKIKNLPKYYLEWMVDNLEKPYSSLAKEVLEEENLDIDLEAAADEFLIEHGFENLVNKKRSKKRKCERKRGKIDSCLKEKCNVLKSEKVRNQNEKISELPNGSVPQKNIEEPKQRKDRVKRNDR